MNIIVSKNVFEGKQGSDSAQLGQYFEMGWELFTTRLKLLLMLAKGEITVNDTIVTHKDRKCLYSAIFKNVIDYNTEYKGSKNRSDKDLVKDCVGILQEQYSPHSELYAKNGLILSSILNVDYLDIDERDKFVCLLVRKRDHDSFRNMSDEYSKNIINRFTNKGIKVYVFGKGAEGFCTNELTKYINLQEWCSYMHHPNCMATIGSISGGLMIGQLCCTNKILLIDPLKHDRNHVLLFSERVNFIKAPTIYYDHIPSVETIFAEAAK